MLQAKNIRKNKPSKYKECFMWDMTPLDAIYSTCTVLFAVKLSRTF
ncbi:hypothetical protein T01_9643 [Trichinella spiralis]|uniref:Uncharacterized protein n=1 Tax=Trichinella spiralis TaxID=6334 RepID=A0A0V0YZM2_TRISP|nr:hypothetical protein T01_9643 [Trichinella spiralis]